MKLHHPPHALCRIHLHKSMQLILLIRKSIEWPRVDVYNSLVTLDYMLRIWKEWIVHEFVESSSSKKSKTKTTYFSLRLMPNSFCPQSLKGNNCRVPYSLWHEKYHLPVRIPLLLISSNMFPAIHFKGSCRPHEIFVLWSLSDGEIPPLYWISGSICGDRLQRRKITNPSPNPFHRPDFGPKEETLALCPSVAGRVGLLINFHLLQKCKGVFHN